MTTYKEIFGKYVRSVASDPPTAAGTGEIWYNTSSNTFKTVGFSYAWSSGGALSTARQSGGGFGTQTAGAVVGGEGPTNLTEEYNGSSWTGGGNYPASYTGIGTTGTQTAGLGFGGGAPYGTTTNAEYNGTSWTGVGSFPLSYTLMGGCGTQTAGLSVGGDAYPTSPRNSNKAFEYNGSTWTAGGDLGTGRYGTMSAGTQTAAATNGGTPSTNATEEYDGSSWTAGGAGLQNQTTGGSSRNGTQDDFITFGTNSPNTAYTQGYNGTSWSVKPALATGRYASTGTGTASAALCIGGRQPAFSTATEEFSGTAAVQTVTTS